MTTAEAVQVMFDSVDKGLRECIAMTQSDISFLKSAIDEGMSVSSAQGRLYEYEKQCKAAERYLKRLEFQLSKLEELKDQYEVHKKMRNGVKTMGYAYALSPGRERDAALSSIKVGFKECTETLGRIESEFESSIGTLLIEMKGIQGFARICPGDVFEITVKYGASQKWKTRGKILKDGVNQLWEHQQTVFKALLGEVLAIKAVEVRGFGKNVVLGNKLCETKNLFSAHPQLMTINLNAIGTLKLNLIVTWNPLHAVDSQSTFPSKVLSKSSTSLFGSMRSLPTLFGGSSLSIVGLGTAGSSKGLRCGTLPSQRPTSRFLDKVNRATPPYFSTSGLQMKHSASVIPVTVKSITNSTSSGSTSSSLHLTEATTSSGFGSGSSKYSGCTSVPGSTLTSPDTESAPIILGHTNGHSMMMPSRKQLSASASNLSRVDSALLNKNPRSVPHDVVIVSADVHAKNPFDHRSLVSSQNKKFFEQSYTDIMEVMDENCTDCSSELTESTPSLNSPIKQLSPMAKNRVNSEPKLHDQVHNNNQFYSPSNPQLPNQNSTSFLNKSTSSFLSLHHHQQGFYINLSDTLINLISSLEDIQGQYSETQSLQVYAQNLFKIIKSISSLRNRIRCLNNNSTSASPTKRSPRRNVAHNRHPSGTSDSFAVESALECFDFLNSAISDNEVSPESSPEHGRYQSKSSKQAASVGNLSDRISDGEAVTSFMTGHRSCNSSVNPSPMATPHPLSTGSEQLDLAIMSHLSYCQKMLENLGSFGPLKQRELKSLENLADQAAVVGKLCLLASNIRDMYDDLINLNDGDDILKAQTISVVNCQKQDDALSYLRDNICVRKLWDSVSYQHGSFLKSTDNVGSGIISVTSKQFSQSIETYIKSFITPNSSSDSLSRSLSPSSFSGTLKRGMNNASILATKVSKLMTTRIVDAPRYESDYVVTSFQVHLFFKHTSLNLEQLFKSFTDEVLLLDSLKSGDAIEVKQSLNKFKRTLPPKEPLFAIALLLLDRDPLIARIAETYFLESNKNRNLRNSLMNLFLEGLESDSSSIRQASCQVLMLLNARETMDQLLYISYADTSSAVREQAKASLFSCGESGRKLYESSQLFAHGFQGLSVK